MCIFVLQNHEKMFLKNLFRRKQKLNLDSYEVFNVYSNEADAYIAKGVLETNGIKCFIVGDTLSSVYPSQLSFAGLRLMVRNVDFFMASQLLNDYEQAQYPS